MLHRSFKPAKCKTSLKLASSRIKLLKNKREAQVKQLKRDLAQLLDSGQDQTARIRVEHVVREEKTMAAYDLLEIYCELIVARLPIIESQKNCPIDLKEAIASVIFASPRCADVPELMDVRKLFTAKYGKDFVSAAVELRPDCGVSRLLVEKLSVKAPDGPTKIKILNAIAEEHNIKWEPKSFGEKDSKPSEDLLDGPSTFNNASQMFLNPPYVQAPPNLDDKGPSNFQAPPKSNENHDVPANFHELNLRPSSGSQTDTDANKTNLSAAFSPESRPTGSGTESMEFRHSYSGDGNASSMGRQNWNMEFKDATAAARAAAESAERASMAARAAAELSSRGNTTWQYSTESQRDEELNRYANSTLQSENHAKGPVSIDHGRNSRMDYEQINRNQQDDVAGIAENIHGDPLKSTNKSGRSASLKYSAASADGSAFVNNLQMADRYYQKNSPEFGQRDNLSEVSLRKQSSRSEVDFADKLQEGLDSKSVDDFEDARIRNQYSHASFHSHSSTNRDDHHVSNYNSQSFGSDADENPFADNEGMIRRNSNKTSSPENASAVYDDYVSDQDECKIDLQGQHKGHEYTEFSSHSGKPSTHMFSKTNAWSERQNIDESPGISTSQSHFSKEHQSDPVFSESWTSSTVPSQPDEMLPATFDDYDVPISISEEELDRSNLFRSKDTNEGNIYSRTSEVTQGENHGFIDSSLVNERNGGSSKPWLQSSSFGPSHVEVHSGRNQGIRVDAGSARKFGYGDVTTSLSSPRFTSYNLHSDDPYSYSQQVDERKHEQSQQPSRFSMGHEVGDTVLTPVRSESMEDTELSKESSKDSGKELNFASLTGGLRNKGYKLQPYKMSSSHNLSSSKQTADHTSTKTEESLSATVKETISPEATSQDPYNRVMRAEADRRPSTRTYSGSHDGDSHDELLQQTSTSSQEQYTKRGGIEENKMSRTQFKYFDSSDSDSEDDFPKEALTNKAHFNTGLSQRTKAFPSNSKESFNSNATILSEASVSPDHVEEKNHPPRRVFSSQTNQRTLSQNSNSKERFYSKASVLSEASVSPDYVEERNSPPRSVFSNQTSKRTLSQSKISGRLRSPDQPRLEVANKRIQESKGSTFNDSLKPSEKEQPSNSLQKIITSGNTESLNAPSSSGETPSKERASHVHPKLPDYDALTAHLQSLRKTHR